MTTELTPGITVLMACHPSRLHNGLAIAAFESIARQTLQPEAIILVNDKDRRGAGHTRQTLLSMVRTKWLAWLDSDDIYLPTHLEKLYQCAVDTDSVFTFSYFHAPYDPFSQENPNGHFGKVFDVANPHHTTITFLARTDIAQEVGFPESNFNHPVSNEDLVHIFNFAKLCHERGLRMTHLPERTWIYRQEGQNSSGLPTLGDAR